MEFFPGGNFRGENCVARSLATSRYLTLNAVAIESRIEIPCIAKSAGISTENKDDSGKVPPSSPPLSLCVSCVGDCHDIENSTISHFTQFHFFLKHSFKFVDVFFLKCFCNFLVIFCNNLLKLIGI